MSRYDQMVDPTTPNNAHSFMLEMVGFAKTVVEFGCGSGHVTRVLVDRGCRVTGLEIDEEAAQQAEQHAERVLVIDLDVEDYAAKLAGEEFDVALLGDVLEHVRDPLSLLRSTRPLLKRGGYAVISIPNVAHVDVRLALLAGRFEYRSLGLLDETHLRFFTLESLQNLVRDAGYRIVELKRVVVPVFTSEVGVSRDSTSADAVREALLDPEAETYQFVARVVRDDADALAASLAERAVASETEVHRLTLQLGRAETRAAEYEAQLTTAPVTERDDGRLASLESLIRELSDQLATERQRADGAQLQLDAEHATKLGRGVFAVRRTLSRVLPAGSKRRALFAALLGGARSTKQTTAAPGTVTFAIARSAEPQVSIVIPCYGHSAMTLRCLRSLSELPDSTPFEVVVVDDASPDDTASLIESVPGVRVVRNTRNLGYLRSCNVGAGAARGRDILLLNNDTEVKPGFLDALVRALADDSVGVVGSKLEYPDGRLQEAGGIVFRDGGAWNYGRNEDPSRFEYGFVREVDYCSGASLLVRGELWRSLHGYDEQYSPAYYEDADLCFAARAAGYRVLYQPASVVIHHEGVSHGTETSSGTKRFQDINHEKFARKWRHALSEQHLPGPENVLLARDRRRGPRVLVIDHYVPTPDRDAGSLRMFRLLQVLVDLGCSVGFLPDNLVHMPRYSDALTQMGIEVFEGSIDFAGELALRGDFVDLVIVSRPQIALRYLPVVRELLPGAFIAYDMVDFQGLREARRDELDGRSKKLGKTYRALELGLVRAADATIAVTDVERAAVLSEEPAANVVIVPTIHEAPWSTTSFENRRDLLFVGSYAHPPNRDGVRWFIDSILPSIVEREPSLRLRLVGSGIDRAEFTHPNVEVLGWLEDLEEVHSETRVFVAPLRYGAGMKGKVADSMARGLPVVTTSIGAEGIGLLDGVDVLIADTPAGFAEAVLRLYTDRDLWSRVRAVGGTSVRKRFGLEATRGYVGDLLALARASTPAEP